MYSKNLRFLCIFFILIIGIFGIRSYALGQDDALLNLQGQVRGAEEGVEEDRQEDEDRPAPSKDLKQAEIRTSGEGLVTRVAPGEFLPFSVKLINFGLTRRVDVTIKYQVFDSANTEVFSEIETVAVETTASFVKQVQLPDDISPGRYTAVSNILYEYQEVPATSRFQFTVEKKILGIFQSTFILYGTITLLISTAFAVVSRLTVKRRRARRLTPHDYSDVSKDERMYYELVSDTIMQMRYRVGEEALEIAKQITDLVIDENGKILEIKKSPAKVIALLILNYEKYLGEKVSFAMRSKKAVPAKSERLSTVNKNLVVVRKYFK